MPSVTPEQQRLFGQAYAIKTGKMKADELNPEYRDQIVKLADSMTKDQLKDFAETKHSEMKENIYEMKNIPTFENFVNESINEAHDLRLSTWEESNGIMKRFRLGSEAINLRSVINISREPWVRNCSSFDNNEIGFDNASDRKKAMAYIEKVFKSNKLKFTDYQLNESLNEAGDLAYWKQYEKGKAPGEEDYSEKVAKTEDELDELFDEVVMWWDTESENPSIPPFGQSRECEELRETAHKYLKKFRSINGRVIDAMVSQSYI